MFHEACHPQNSNARLTRTGSFDLPLMFIRMGLLTLVRFKMRAAQLETASSITVKKSNLALNLSIAPYDGQLKDQMNVDDQTQSKALTLQWRSILHALT